MSKGMQLLGIILLGIFTLVIVYLMSDVRSTGELDYYLLQEVTEASMYDAVDYSYYRNTGYIRVDRDMFLENFNRRFAQSVNGNRSYNIKIIDFNEIPPKVTIEVNTLTVASVKGESAYVTTRVSGIIETIYDDYVYSRPGGDGAGGVSYYKDKTPPTVSLIGQSKIKLTDNIALDKYCLGYLPVNKTINDNDYFECNAWANNAYGQKEIEINLNEEIYSYFNDQSGYKKAVMVYDRGGNITLSTIVYEGPAVSLAMYNDLMFSGHLKIEVQDFYVPTQYSIYVKNDDGSERQISGWKNFSGTVSKENNSDVRYISEAISYFARDYLKNLSGDINIVVKVKNEKGYQGQSTLKYTISNSSPVISNTVAKKSDHTITWTYEDADKDVRYYAITTSSSKPKWLTDGGTPNTEWTSVGNWGSKGTAVKSNIKEDTVYYVWVVDAYGNYTSNSYVINKDYSATKYCTEGYLSDDGLTCMKDGCGACDAGKVWVPCENDSYTVYSCDGSNWSSTNPGSCSGTVHPGSYSCDSGFTGPNTSNNCYKSATKSYEQSNCVSSGPYAGHYNAHKDEHNCDGSFDNTTRTCWKKCTITYTCPSDLKGPTDNHNCWKPANKSSNYCDSGYNYNSESDTCTKSPQKDTRNGCKPNTNTYVDKEGTNITYDTCTHYAACSVSNAIAYKCDKNGVDGMSPTIDGTMCRFYYDGSTTNN